MRTMWIGTLLTVVFLAGCASEKGESVSQVGFNMAGIDKIAIIEVSGAVAGDAAKNQIGDFFAMELLRRGYSPIERGQVQAVLKEQQFQASDLTSDVGAASAGKILNVPAVMVVNIPKYSEEMNMTAKIIDTEDASIRWIGSGSGRTGKTLATIFGAAAGAAAGATIAGDNRDDKVIGGVAGGVLGGAAGRALTPQQAEQCQKVIKKVCANLPSRVATNQ